MPYHHLTLEERRTSFRLLNAKVPAAEIAGHLAPTVDFGEAPGHAAAAAGATGTTSRTLDARAHE